MPELPEVEFGRTVADTVARGRLITGVRCARDTIVFDGISIRQFREAVLDRRVHAVHRHGKHLWFALDTRPWPTFHFGMTGSFRTPSAGVLRLASSPSRDSTIWPPRFAKVRFTFDDGGELVMTNKRRLGRIRLRHDPATEPPISLLGFDPLLAMPTPRDFLRRLRGRTGNIKGLLLDQRFAAGVGNWIADEVLFQARIDPRRTADTLSEPEGRRLRAALRRVIHTAVKVDADQSRFPRGWLFHVRWGRAANARTSAGDGVVFETVAGRTTAWVPAVQR